MRVFKRSSVLLSKFRGYTTESKLKISSLSAYKSLILPQPLISQKLLESPVIISSNTTFLHYFSTKSGKIFKENENEYAHFVMEKSEDYSRSVIKLPLKIRGDEESNEQFNIFDKFVRATVDNSVSSSLENPKFSNLVKNVCDLLPQASDKDLKKTLHYLCMWPPTPKTFTPHFKALWNTLDQECIKRLKNWDEKYYKKISSMAEKSNHFVFVYGTLKRGEPNCGLIEKRSEGEATFIGNAKTIKKWPLVIASRYNIPYLLHCEGKGENVIGDIYEVDDVMLAKLDELENHPSYYTRIVEEVEITSETGCSKRVIKPWMYFLTNFRSELLELPFLSNYSSKGSHGLEYVSRCVRRVNYYSEVMNV